jgi:putative colanic acid biosysnthesis UDP-glucose lipid carrier transferase
VNIDGTPTASMKALAMERPAGGLIRPYQRELELMGRVLDLMAVAISLRVSILFSGWEWAERYTLLTALACVLFYLSAEANSVYHDRRSAPLRVDLGKLFVAWVAAAVAILVLGYLTKVSHLYSRVGVATWLFLAPATLVAIRVVERAALMKIRSLGYNTRRVAIIGASEQGLRVAATILAQPWIGLELLGIYDDRAPAPGRMPDDLPCKLLGTTKDLVAEFTRRRVDMVYVTLPINNTGRIFALLDALSDTTVSVYFVPDMFLFTMVHGRWVRIGDVPAVSVFETPFHGIEGMVKRTEDLLVAIAVLLLMGLPMMGIACAIRLLSRGPAIFKQRRYGLDGREFRMWKFRTMSVCEDDAALAQATRHDGRVTRLGAWLRRTSLDELPQFLNVLGGSMSVVGPRPHATAHNEHYRRRVKHYMIRHKVRPGITGWAQVNGLRGETETVDKMQRRVEFDLWYIRNWSIVLDLRVMALTLVRGWRDGNAY